MGQMKNLYLEQLDDEDDMDSVGDTQNCGSVYVLTCNGKPCNVYSNKATADYEMWLCNQAAVFDPDGYDIPVYAVTETTLYVDIA